MSSSPSTPRKIPRQERSIRTVERILDAATRIFHEQGYAGTTTNDIADRAELSIGSLYQYFPNKDAVLVALTRRHIEAAETGLDHLLGRPRSDAGVEQILRDVVNFLVEQHDLDDLHLLVMHAAPRTLEISLELDRARTRLVDLAADLLSPVVADRHRRSLTARMVVATLDAAVHDVILRQPRGAARTSAIELTITTAMSVIAAAADQGPMTLHRGC